MNNLYAYAFFRNLLDTRHRFLSITISVRLVAVAALMVQYAAPVTAQDFIDRATHVDYNDGFQVGDNGNFGSSNFSAWTFDTFGFPVASIGGSGGFIDISGKSFRINRLNLTDIEVIRSFTPPSPSPATVVIVDADQITGQGFVRIHQGTNFRSLYQGSAGTWRLFDATSFANTGIPELDPVRAKWIIDSDNSYDSRLTSLIDGTVVSYTGRSLFGGGIGSNINELRFQNFGESEEMAFNNIIINSTPADLQDDASQGVYSDSWTTSYQDNGDSGGLSSFLPWALTLPGGSTATIASAGATDVNGASFQVFNDGSGVAFARREFAPLTPNPTTIIQFTAVMTSGASTIRLRDTGGFSEALRLEDNGGFWSVVDNSGAYVSSVLSSTAIMFSAIVDTTGAYDFAIRDLVGMTTDTQLGRNLNSVTGDAIAEIVFQAGLGNTLSFNSLKIDTTGSIDVPVELSSLGLE